MSRPRRGTDVPVSTVLLSGYYGFGNVGDEAILAATIAAMRDARPDLAIEVLSANPQSTARQYGVRATSRSSPLHILAAVRRAGLVMSGGGGLLQDVSSRSSPLYYLGVLRLAQLLRRKTMVFAQGIGPLRTPRNIALTLSCFRRAGAITVRDQASGEWLRQHGFSESDFLIGADPALLLEPCATDRATHILAQHGVPMDAPCVGICARPWHGAAQPSATVAAMADGLARELDAHVLLLPFHPRTDVQLAGDAAGQMSQPATVLDSVLSPGEALGVIGRLKLLIGMRLHSLIFAALAGTPLLGISYDPKIDAFLESIGRRPAASVEALDHAAVTAAARQTVATSEQQRGCLEKRIAALREAAQHSVRAALQLLD